MCSRAMLRRSQSCPLHGRCAWDLTFPRYQTLLGCGGISLTNTSSLYARFTTTVICNAIVQNSIRNCSLSSEASRPVCADTCVSACLWKSWTSLTTNRLNSPKAKHTSLQIMTFAPSRAVAHKRKSGPISRTVRFRRIHCRVAIALQAS